MKTRQRTGPSAWACNNVGQIPCLDAHQGAMPSSGHFQLSSLLLSPGLCPLGSSYSFLIYGLLILPPHGYGTCQSLPTAQLSPLTLLVLSPGCNISSLPQNPAVLGRQTPLSHSDPIKPDSTPLCIHPQTANTKRDSCLVFQAWRTPEAVLPARPFLKALSDAAVCSPVPFHRLDGGFPQQHRKQRCLRYRHSGMCCAEKHCCALISLVWHQIFPAHFDSPVILFPCCQGGWIILLALGHTRESARIISPSVFKSRTAFPTLTSMDRAYTTVIIKGIFLPKKEIPSKDWKIHIN